jgi:hypothetical protein
MFISVGKKRNGIIKLIWFSHLLKNFL